MAQTVWNGEVLAKSDDTAVVEGNHYFPPESVREELLTPSDHTTICGWKGEASYYHVEVDGEVNENAAWYYLDPSDEAAEIEDHVAFWNGVDVTG